MYGGAEGVRFGGECVFRPRVVGRHSLVAHHPPAPPLSHPSALLCTPRLTSGCLNPFRAPRDPSSRKLPPRSLPYRPTRPLDAIINNRRSLWRRVHRARTKHRTLSLHPSLALTLFRSTLSLSSSTTHAVAFYPQLSLSFSSVPPCHSSLSASTCVHRHPLRNYSAPLLVRSFASLSLSLPRRTSSLVDGFVARAVTCVHEPNDKPVLELH